MKLPAIFPACLILAISFPSLTARAQQAGQPSPSATPSPPPAAAAADNGENSNSALEKAIVNVTYTWEPEGDAARKVTFRPNGIGKNTFFPITWRIKGPHELEIGLPESPERGTVIFHFNKDFTEYTAVDFDGASKLKGTRIDPHEKDTFATDGKGSKEALEEAIINSTYSWEPKGDTMKKVTFLANGTGKNTFFDITWNVRGPYELEVGLADEPDRGTIILHFNNDYTAYTAVDFDATHKLIGRKLTAPNTAPPPSVATAVDEKSKAAFEKAIVNVTYTWEPESDYAKKITFLPDGVGRNTFFDITWRIKGAHELEIGLPDAPERGTITLQFNKDFTEYTTVDFDGVTKLKGRQINPNEKDTFVTDGSGTREALEKALVNSTYTWEPEGDYSKKVSFLPNGKGTSTFFDITWHIRGPYEVEVGIAGEPEHGTIIFQFNKDYTAYRTTDFDGVHKLTGHKIVKKETGN